MIAALRRRTRGDAGTTLTELNITMIVLAIIVAATLSLIVGFQTSNAQNMSRQEQIDSARYSVELMSRSLRAAVKPAQVSAACTTTTCTEDAFLQGDDFVVQFYANLNNANGAVGPSRVTYTITGGSLVETIQVPDSATPTASGFQYCDATATAATSACKARVATRLLAEGVQTDPAAPLFRYWDKNGTLLDPDLHGGSLDGTEMTSVVAVEVVINVQAPNATRAEPTEYIQRIMLPNVQAIIRQEEEETP